MSGVLRRLRRPFNGLAAASAALCACICILWVISYIRPVGLTQTVEWVNPRNEVVSTDYDTRWFASGALVSEKVIRIWPALFDTPEADDRMRRHWSLAAGGGADDPPHYDALGFSFNPTGILNINHMESRTGSSFPLWPAALAASLLPGLALLRRCARRRVRQAGFCLACGYDLRATPEAGGALVGRCPECGTIPAGKVGP